MQRTRAQLIEDKERNVRIYPNDRFSLKYETGKKLLTIDNDFQHNKANDKKSILLYLFSATHWDNAKNEPITEQERKTIQRDLEYAVPLLLENAEAEFC